MLRGSSSAASRMQLCFSDGYSHVTVKLFEVTTWHSPSLMFTQAFWAALDTNRGSAAEWRHWASLRWVSDGDGETSLSSTQASWWQAASRCCPPLAGMLRKRCPGFARMLGKRCPEHTAHAHRRQRSGCARAIPSFAPLCPTDFAAMLPQEAPGPPPCCAKQFY